MYEGKAFCEQACFSDGTADYVIPAEPKHNEPVRIRFRAPIGTEAVFLHDGSGWLHMSPEKREGIFSFFDIRLYPGRTRFYYRFRILYQDVNYYYDRIGFSEQERTDAPFCIAPGFSVPEWSKGAVMYQIFTDRFCNGSMHNSVRTGEYYYINRQTRAVDNWYKYPENFDVADFYGGDLAGVWSKLDYLQDLGVEVLYFNPLFVSASSHKYDTQDYDYIDPHYGVILEDDPTDLAPNVSDNRQARGYIRRVTSKKNLEASNRFFADFVTEVHRRGMRVILDGVFNHCGSFNKWLDRERIYENAEGFSSGAYLSADSPYHDFFRFSDENAFPMNESYEGWWDHKTLPKLNYEASSQLENYILRIACKWVSPPYNCDGWRLDVAADLGHSKEYNHVFWKKFRNAVKRVNPDAIIIAEYYGDPTDWLGGDQWDTVMNYDAFMEPVSWFLTGMEKHSEEYRSDLYGNEQFFRDTMRRNMAHFLTPSLQSAMNQLSNHDHSRFLTRTNRKVGRAYSLGKEAASQDINKGVFKEAVVMLMTTPGAPTLYYGDEAGVCGFTDPDNRRTYPWGQEDREMIRFHRDIIKIHKENPAFRTGSVKYLTGKMRILSYARFNQEQQFVIVLNNDEYSRMVEIDVWEAGIPMQGHMTQILYTNEMSYSTREVDYPIENGQVRIALPRYSSVILRAES